MVEGPTGPEIDETDYELLFALTLTRDQFTKMLSIARRVYELVPEAAKSNWLLDEVADAASETWYQNTAERFTVRVKGIVLSSLQDLLHLANALRCADLDDNNEMWEAFGLANVLRRQEAAGPIAEPVAK
jgi:hypothetical protein